MNSETSMPRPEPGIYCCFDGTEYMVVGAARHTETEEELIVYTNFLEVIQGSSLRAQPTSKFQEQVRVGDELVPRFTFAEPPEDEPDPDDFPKIKPGVYLDCDGNEIYVVGVADEANRSGQVVIYHRLNDNRQRLIFQYTTDFLRQAWVDGRRVPKFVRKRQ